MSSKFDFCVIGGGIVGVATARALLIKYPGSGVVLLEKERELGRHQTGRNSGVIHSGIYYAPGSLKAKLCAEGERRTKAFCREFGIPFDERGKLIVATNAIETERLNLLAERAKVNGIVAEQLTKDAISEREPAIAGSSALHVPKSAIVDYKRVLQKLAEDFVARGGTLALGSAVDDIKENSGQVDVRTRDRTISANQLVACAGLQSDRLARMSGLKTRHKIVPFRGEYFNLGTEKQNIVKAMIYPVPDPALPFLGIHLTPMIDGRLTVGPNAVLGFAREGYRKGSVSLVDTLSFGTFPGFWRTAFKNFSSGREEILDSIFKSRYLRACQKYCPSLTLGDLQPMEPGIRAQAVLTDGSLVHDFLFLESERMLHVCNAPSPAATSALPIADMIVDKLSVAA